MQNTVLDVIIDEKRIVNSKNITIEEKNKSWFYNINVDISHEKKKAFKRRYKGISR